MSLAADSLVHLPAAAISGSTSKRIVFADPILIKLSSARFVPQAPGEQRHGARYSTLVRKDMGR